MELIPVIDLKGGVVVKAIAGRRKDYQPIRSHLFEGASPSVALEGILRAGHFPTVYIADLDRLMGVGSQHDQIDALVRSVPGVEFWVDSGWPDRRGPLWPPNMKPVIGTESFEKGEIPKSLGSSDEWILSLDFMASELIGPPAILSMSEKWPRKVIVMSLGAVGRQLGPDFDLLSRLQSRNSQTQFFLAGGVRNLSDVNKAGDLGAAGVLMASALHAGHLMPDFFAKT
jgi:phosphoribosylformimino-5-aminoimidazole carboxamide ribotide isomerase